MSNDKKTVSKVLPPIELPDGTFFRQYGVTTRLATNIKAPDWTFWQHMIAVEPWQAVALSLNIDPDRLKSGLANQDAQATYDKRLRLLANHRPAGAPVDLRKFALWVFSFGWDMPPELLALAHKPDKLPGAPAPQCDAAASAGNGEPEKVVAAGTATEADKSKQEFGEPFLQKGKNCRADVEKWVAWQARHKVKDNENGNDLATTILGIAEQWGYESERKKMSIASITKMIPAGLTGGRSKNKGSKKKATK